MTEDWAGWAWLRGQVAVRRTIWEKWAAVQKTHQEDKVLDSENVQKVEDILSELATHGMRPEPEHKHAVGLYNQVVDVQNIGQLGGTLLRSCCLRYGHM